jgi:hypothetical protein
MDKLIATLKKDGPAIAMKGIDKETRDAFQVIRV